MGIGHVRSCCVRKWCISLSFFSEKFFTKKFLSFSFYGVYFQILIIDNNSENNISYFNIITLCSNFKMMYDYHGCVNCYYFIVYSCFYRIYFYYYCSTIFYFFNFIIYGNISMDILILLSILQYPKQTKLIMYEAHLIYSELDCCRRRQ